MKRIIGLCLALVMVMVPMLGMAEDTQKYEAADGAYSFSYPSSYNVLASNTISSLLDIAVANADEQIITLVEQVRPQIESLGLIILMNNDKQSNISIAPTPMNMEISSEMLLSLVDVFKPMLEGQIPGIEFVGEQEIVQLGEYNALQMQYEYTLADIAFSAAQCYVGIGTDLYVCTVTANAGNYAEQMANMQSIVASITVAE